MAIAVRGKGARGDTAASTVTLAQSDYNVAPVASDVIVINVITVYAGTTPPTYSAGFTTRQEHVDASYKFKYTILTRVATGNSSDNFTVTKGAAADSVVITGLTLSGAKDYETSAKQSGLASSVAIAPSVNPIGGLQVPASAASGSGTVFNATVSVASGSPKPDLTPLSISWSVNGGAFGTPAITTNDQVVFRAAVRNIGLGPTPAGTNGVPGGTGNLDVTFFVDSNLVSWEDTDGLPLAINTTRNETANGGGPSGVNYWIATSGAHTVTATVNILVPPRIDEGGAMANNSVSTSITVTGAVNPQPGDEVNGFPASQIILHSDLSDMQIAWINSGGLVSTLHLGGVGFPSREPGSQMGWAENPASATPGGYQEWFRDHSPPAGFKSYIGFRERVEAYDYVMVAPWHDDAAWNARLATNSYIRTQWRAVKNMGKFHGEYRDGEPYEMTNFNHAHAWETDYSGNPLSHAATLAKAYDRGKAEGVARAADWPNSEYASYINSDGYLPGGWDEEVQLVSYQQSGGVNGRLRQGNGSNLMTFTPYHLGLWETGQYSRIILGHAVLYRSTQMSGGSTFLGATQHNMLGIASWISRNYPTAWAAIYDKISFSGDHWFDQPFTSEFGGVPMDPGAADDAATSSNRYNRFGWVLYNHQGLGYNYGPYATALSDGSSTSVVDTTLPTCTVNTPTRNGLGINVSGFGQHAHGVMAIAWALYSGGTSTTGTGTLVSTGVFGFDIEWLSGFLGSGIRSSRSNFSGNVPSAPSGYKLDVAAWTIHGQHHAVRVTVP